MAANDDLRSAELAAAEARTDTKIARMEGRIDVLGERLAGKLDHLSNTIRDTDAYNRNTRMVLVSVIVGAVVAIGALIVGMATYGDALFGRGMNVRDVVQSTIKDYEAQRKASEQPTKSP